MVVAGESGFPEIWKTKTPHLSILGLQGTGKTTILNILSTWYRVHVVRRYTCRPRRPGEECSHEYVFVSKGEFLRLLRARFFIRASVRRIPVNGEIFYTGLPCIENWSPLPPGTQLVLSILGTSVFHVMEDVPELRTVFVDHPSSFVLMKRAYDRSRAQGIDPDPKLRTAHRYGEKPLWRAYHYRVLNNQEFPEECAREIARIAGLA